MRFWADRLDAIAEFASQRRVLHVGPGRDQPFGVSIDISPSVNPDVVGDANGRRLPFRADAFDGAFLFSVLEHLPDTFGTLSEVHRVVRGGGLVVVLVPHAASASAFIDPTHEVGFGATSFDYMIEGTELFKSYGFYTTSKYKLLRRNIDLAGRLNRVPGLHGWVNRHSALYDAHLCYVIRPSGIYFELEVEK